MSRQQPKQLSAEFPDHDDPVWNTKESSIKYFLDLQESYEHNIHELGIISDKILRYLRKNSSVIKTCTEDLVDDSVFESKTRPIFAKLDEHFAQLDIATPQWRSILLQCMILKKVTPQILGARIFKAASGGEKRFNKNMAYVQNINLMKKSLECGEPLNGNYAKAFRIYNSIQSTSENFSADDKAETIFHRLALAVAFEYSQVKHVFDDITHQIDPVARYFHYEKAYLDGELDSNFSALSAWELRMVVDNDASDDEIEWCRRMMRNYRPDHIFNPDYHWKYCKIVKTEIQYKTPDWKQSPRTYKQLISGGGKCGPRAWFGRFSCKSFGIPTWGIQQPGHAAMSHWMPSTDKAWTICLGGQNWENSRWNDKKGRYFDWETRARAFPQSFDSVIWLRCFGCIEGTGNGANNDTKQIWDQIQLLKMRQIGLSQNIYESSSFTNYHNSNDSTLSSIQRKKETSLEHSYVIVPKNVPSMSDNTFTLQASNFLERSNQYDVIVANSFHPDGGDQVHLRANAKLVYSITLPVESDNQERKFFKYHLSCQIVTVHAETKPLFLQVKNGIKTTSHQIQIPYSEGEWTSTKPIEVELLAKAGKKNLLTFSRKKDALGLTIKDFKFERLGTAP